MNWPFCWNPPKPNSVAFFQKASPQIPQLKVVASCHAPQDLLYYIPDAITRFVICEVCTEACILI